MAGINFMKLAIGYSAWNFDSQKRVWDANTTLTQRQISDSVSVNPESSDDQTTDYVKGHMKSLLDPFVGDDGENGSGAFLSRQRRQMSLVPHDYLKFYDIKRKFVLYSNNILFYINGDFSIDVGNYIYVKQSNESVKQQLQGWWVVIGVMHMFRSKATNQTQKRQFSTQLKCARVNYMKAEVTI